VTGSCPSCGATVRAGDPWCTLCYADLRPKPPAPPAVDPLTAPLDVLVAAAPAAAPEIAAAAPEVAVAAPAPVVPAAPVDPLTAPLSAVLAQPLAADPGAPSTVTWPCVDCGGRSPIEAAACTTCGTPFGGRITRLDDVRALRQRRMVIAVACLAAFLVLLGAFTLATTKEPPKGQPAPGPTIMVP
jgi:hypothetical protein